MLWQLEAGRLSLPLSWCVSSRRFQSPALVTPLARPLMCSHPGLRASLPGAGQVAHLPGLRNSPLFTETARAGLLGVKAGGLLSCLFATRGTTRAAVDLV